MAGHRLNVTLDDAHAAKLAELAERAHVNEGTLARSLLSAAIDDASPNAATVTAVLDSIDGAWEQAQRGLAEVAAGQGVPLDRLSLA